MKTDADTPVGWWKLQDGQPPDVLTIKVDREILASATRKGIREITIDGRAYVFEAFKMPEIDGTFSSFYDPEDELSDEELDPTAPWNSWGD